MTRSLLIVENDRELLDLLNRRLLQCGYSVTAVHHPRQALEAATFKEFDAAVVDFTLPEMDGLRLMRKLKKLVAGVEVIVISDLDDKAFETEAMEFGAYAYVCKPCRISHLEDLLKMAVDATLVEKGCESSFDLQ